MENMETMVDFMQQASAPDNTVQANAADSLESIIEETPAQTQQEQQKEKEPGWIKQRVNKAVEKAVAEAEARVSARYEEMLAPIRESVLERQANDLVAQGEFKSLERAKEYLRLKGGMPVQSAETPKTEPKQPARDDQGRFTASKDEGDDAARHARADILAKQAQKIKGTRGVDVMDMFHSDDTVKQRVLSGEWDFYDVLDAMQSKRSTPSAVRNPNSGAVSGVSIMGMTDEQFARLQANLAAGRTYDMRK